MNPEIKAEWLRRLRSGQYVQGKRKLRRTIPVHGEDQIHYCCLGVLCEIAAELGMGEWKDGESWSFFEGNPNYPSSNMLVRMGIDSEGDYELVRELADMNDSGATFEVIADKIEAEL